jgi:hypothetical protein
LTPETTGGGILSYVEGNKTRLAHGVLLVDDPESIGGAALDHDADPPLWQPKESSPMPVTIPKTKRGNCFLTKDVSKVAFENSIIPVKVPE